MTLSPARPPALDAVRPRRRHPAHEVSPVDRDVLWLYLLTRVGLWVTAYCARQVFPANPAEHRAAPVLSSWRQWDWGYYLHIARDGYFPSGPAAAQAADNRQAFFPGFPLVLRAVHLVVPYWTAAGLLISFTAGGVAVLALARLARLDSGGRDDGRRTALIFLVSPCAVFLAAGYTEALFLALALPAWLAARRGAWPQAAVLTCLATAVRVNGLFLTGALGLLFLLSRPRDWRQAPLLALPLAPPLLYSWYLRAHTGDWMAWQHAESRGWYRDFHAPWTAWHHTWTAAFSHDQTTAYAVTFRAELVAMAVGLLLLAVLLRRRRWPEALYMGLTLWALGTSYWYMSIPRAALLWFPLWPALAVWTVRRPRLSVTLLAPAVPLFALVALTFFTGRWAG